MNPSPLPPVARRPARRWWLWVLFGAPLLLLLILAATAASVFHLDSDARALRNGLMKSGDIEWRQQIALNANWLLVGIVRGGLSCVKLDPGARAALRSVRSGGVGIYQVASGTRPDRAAILGAADSAMNARDWQRVVEVMDGKELVAVYLPEKNISVHHLKCCVLVFDGKQMVLVSARCNPEPILTYALKQADLGGQAKWLAQR